MNKKSEFYKYANYYLARLIKAAAPYRDNTIPAGSVLQANIDEEINNTNTFKPYINQIKKERNKWIKNRDAVIAYYNNSSLPSDYVENAKARENEFYNNRINEANEDIARFNTIRRDRKRIYQAMQPRPGQPARDYQKAQTENYNNMVNNVINSLDRTRMAYAKRNETVGSRVNPSDPYANVGGAVLAATSSNPIFNNGHEEFMRTNKAYRNAENERQILLSQIPEQFRDYVANTKIRIMHLKDNFGLYDKNNATIDLAAYNDGSLSKPGTAIHEGLHGVTVLQPNTPMNNAIVNKHNPDSMALIDVNGKKIPQAQLTLKNELRSINGTERIMNRAAEALPEKQRKYLEENSTDDAYRFSLFRDARLKHKPKIRKSKLSNIKGQYITSKLEDKIVRDKGINVNKILGIEPADKEWNNTYAQGFGKAYKENPELIDWLMEEKTKNYRLKPTATGKDRWNRASKKNKKSSILDNVEIALEKNKEKKDLLDWYRRNREAINYQWGVNKAVERHERKAKRKKLERPVWEARRRSFGKIASYYPLLLHKYIYK